MERGEQTKIAEKAGISDSFLSQILKGVRRPSWRSAKILAKITNTKPELWLDGEPEKIKEVLKAVNF